MGDYGFKVTRDGYGITSTEPREYAFNSLYANVKIAASGSGQLTVNAGADASVTIAHNLNFIPMSFIYTEVNPSSGRYYFGGIVLPSDDADYNGVYVDCDIDSNGDLINTYLDSTNLVLGMHNSGGTNKTVNYKYYIFADNGA